MPRQIYSHETYDALRSEANFTIARIVSDPLTQPLAAKTAGWLSDIDASESIARQVAAEEAIIDAERVGGNAALDEAVGGFSDDLRLEVKKDMGSVLWRTHFRDITVSDFLDLPLAAEVAAVEGWLAQSQAASMAEHKDTLQSAVNRVRAAQAKENEFATKRGALWQSREDLAKKFTQQRDELAEALATLGRANGKRRKWPSTFFRKRAKKSKKKSTPAA